MKTTVTITRDAWDEYRVPSPDGTEAGAYYTDDKQDAYDTAKQMYKQADMVVVKYRSVEEHPQAA